MCTQDLYGITGTASSGKTSVLSELARRGYRTIREAASDLIGEGYHPRNDFHGFQRRVLERNLVDLSARGVGTYFMDRPVADILAYYALAGEPVPERTALLAEQYLPQRVFLLERLPLVDNGIRYEDAAGQLRLDEAIRKVYRTLGADVVEIPAEWQGSIEESVAWRADRILAHVGASR